MTIERYTRQIALPEIGAAGQEKLNGARVLCVGAGGLGCPALLYLAGAGVGAIGIIDYDSVDISNLQRQVLFTANDASKPKAAAAKARLSALNPDIEITAYDKELTAENAVSLFSGYDVIIDGTDNFAAKFLINDAAIKCGKPFIFGAIQGFDGQASVFGLKGGPCYRCLYPQMPEVPIMNCAEAGVIGAVAGIVGVTQALQAIQLITGHESFAPLAGKLWTIDMRTMQTQILNLAKNPSCPVCSRQEHDIALEYASPVCGFVSELTPDQLRKAQNYILIDVREDEEWDTGHIEHARHWPLSRMMAGELPDELPPHSDIVLHCQKGVRSIKAAQILKAAGHFDVYSLAGGYEAWLEKTGG